MQLQEKACADLVKNRDIKYGVYHNHHCTTTYVNQWPKGNVSVTDITALLLFAIAILAYINYV